MSYYNICYYRQNSYSGYDSDDVDEIVSYTIQSPNKELVNVWCKYNPVLNKSNNIKGYKKYSFRDLLHLNDHKLMTCESNHNGIFSKYYYVIYTISYKKLKDTDKWKDIISINKEKIDKMILDIESVNNKIAIDKIVINNHQKRIDEEKNKMKAIKRKNDEKQKIVNKKYKFE